MAVSTDPRRLILDQLTASDAQLLAQLANLSPAQWHFRESPTRWSIAENLEHLILFEAFIRSAVQRTIETPAEPDKSTNALQKESCVLDLANSRATKFSARAVVRPTGSSPDPINLIADFQTARAETIAFAADTRADLRTHFFPHIAFGDLDCYQWLLLLGQHTQRHIHQIAQIKADPSYPPA